jgi:hypothetical protein
MPIRSKLVVLAVTAAPACTAEAPQYTVVVESAPTRSSPSTGAEPAPSRPLTRSLPRGASGAVATWSGPRLGSEGEAFDRLAAAKALASVDPLVCRTADGPTGRGHVKVTFDVDGSVASAVVDAGPYPGTAVGSCLAAAYATVAVPPFGGAPVRVGKSFTIP